MNGYCEQSVNNDVNFFQGNSIYSSQNGALSCLCDAEGSRTNPKTRKNYEWVSNNCTMVRSNYYYLLSLLLLFTVTIIIIRKGENPSHQKCEDQPNNMRSTINTIFLSIGGAYIEVLIR